jgi:hypothetical protein
MTARIHFKQYIFLTLLLISVSSVRAQSQFNKEQMFLGTGLNLGYFNGFIIGLNPELGYSFNDYVDAGVTINFNYISQFDPNFPITYQQIVYGGGPFLRIWPMDRFFLGGQYEYNTIGFSEKNNGIINSVTFNASSLLVGVGFGSRLIGNSQFYTSIMIDVMGDRKSPYVDQFNRQLPVFRTGFNFYFGRNSASRPAPRERR